MTEEETEEMPNDEELDIGYDSDDSLLMDPELLAIMQEIENEKSDEEVEDIPNQKDPRGRKMKSVLKEWGMGSSCHGVPHMSEAHTCLVILLWSAVLLVCLGTFAYLFSDNLTQYLDYPYQVMVKMAVEDMDFPAVTICNINPYKLEEIESVAELGALLIVYERAALGIQ